MSTVRSVCLVTVGRSGPDSGALHAALSLALRGVDVHLLCGNASAKDWGFRATHRRLESAGVRLALLEDLPLPIACRAPNGTPGCGDALVTSNLIRYGVELLHRQSNFDAIVFPTAQAVGFRSLQAKQTGVAFRGVRLAVRLDGIDQWTREADKRWPNPGDLFLDYCERYTFETADVQISHSEYLLNQSRRLGWKVRSDAYVIPLQASDSPAGPQIVYIGGLEQTAPLQLFMSGIAGLDPGVSVAFLCHALSSSKRRRAASQIASALPGRRCELRCLDRGQILAYLAQGRRLAVVCDCSETLAPELRDCHAAGIPFLAARPAWLPGHITDGPAPDSCFFDADADDAVERLHADIRIWCEDAVCRSGGDALLNALQAAGAPFMAHQAEDGASPAATVAVSYFNLGKYLPETLASLAAQTFSDVEVLVVDDGSTEEKSLQVWAEQRELYPQFRFIRQNNRGLGAARNAALQQARGEYFIPVDADNIAAPNMVDAFVHGMRNRPDVAALSCFFLAFKDSADIQEGKFLYQYCPTGGPHFAACFFNVYGDANAVFRTADLRAVGGFETDRSTYCHDWETFVKLARSGRRIGVIPEYLFYYRRRADGMAAVMTRQGADLYPFVQRMMTTFFAAGAAISDADTKMLWTAAAGYFLQNLPAPRIRPSLLSRLVRKSASLYRWMRQGIGGMLRRPQIDCNCSGARPHAAPRPIMSFSPLARHREHNEKPA